MLDTINTLKERKNKVKEEKKRADNEISVNTSVVALKTDLTNKMDKTNPTSTGSFSLNRKSMTSIGEFSFAEGYQTSASAYVSHAEGGSTVANGSYSHAEGYQSVANGDYSHAEGHHTRPYNNWEARQLY